MLQSPGSFVDPFINFFRCANTNFPSWFFTILAVANGKPFRKLEAAARSALTVIVNPLIIVT